MGRIDRRLKSTAFHEAGHAVAVFQMNIPIRKVTIVPEGDALGYVLRSGVSFPKKVRQTLESSSRGTIRYCFPHEFARAQYLAERHAMYCLAGIEAQRQFDPKSVRHYHWRQDRESALQGLYYIVGDDEVPLYWRLLRQRTMNLLTLPGAWAAIRTLAKELIRRKTLSGNEAVAAIRRGFDKDFERRVARRTGVVRAGSGTQ